MHWAAKKGDVEMLHLLHGYGAKLDLVTTGGALMYPIHWAAEQGRIGAIRFLIQSGADMNVQDANGCTPLVFAAQNNQINAVIFLWKSDADMSVTDTSGDSAHHWAAYKGLSELMGLLYHIDPHAVNKTDNFGQSPVHLAAMRGNEDVLQFLIEECRADVSVRDRNGHTPLELAIKKSHVKCELTLRKYAGQNMLSIFQNIGLTRIKQDNRMVSSIFCAANDKEMANWPWRVVFVSNFIATIVTVGNIMNPVLQDLGKLHVCNAIIQSLWWFCFIMCLMQSPSLVKDDIEHYNAALELIGTAVTDEGLPNLCHSCRVRRPLRSKHCKIQRRCVNKFDHFCPFVGNTVGRDNYMYFFGLLICHMVAGSMWLATVVYLMRRESVSWSLLIFALYSFGWMFMLAGLLQYHSYLIMNNLTTNEHINAHKYSYLKSEIGAFDNPFAKGGCGSNVMDGLFPSPVQFFSREEVLTSKHGRTPEDKMALLV